MSGKGKKHKMKQTTFEQKKKLRTEEPTPEEDTPQVVASTSQQGPFLPRDQPIPSDLLLDSDSEEELTNISQSSSIDDDVFEDSETQTSEVLAYYPEKTKEKRKKLPPRDDYPSFKQLAEALGPIDLKEIKVGPIRPDITPTFPKPSTSKEYSEEFQQVYEAVVTKTETLPSRSSAKRRRFAESTHYKITPSVPSSQSLDNYSYQILNLKSYEQVVLGVPRGITFQYYNCEEFFFSISQVDLYLINKKGSREQEFENPHHTHVHFPGEIYMCKKTNAEGRFSRSKPTSKVKKSATHVHIKSIEDVMAPLNPDYSRLPQYIFVKSGPFAKTQQVVSVQASDYLYPSDFFELLFSAYKFTNPKLKCIFSYFRMIPGNFDILLGVPRSALYEEYHCCPKIVSMSGVDLYFMAKERVDPQSKNVQSLISDIHTHVHFPTGIRACMFKNTPTKYLLMSSCPSENEVKCTISVSTSSVPGTKTTIKTDTLAEIIPEISAEEEEAEEFSESESSSSSSSLGKPNCYLKLTPVKGSVYIGMPKEALCHYNPKTNKLDSITGTGIYFVEESELERDTATNIPHHVHLDFNSDAYLCRFNGDAIVFDTGETCTRLFSAPATTIMAPGLSILPKGKPIKSDLSARLGLLEEQFTPTLVPITHDVATTSVFESSQSCTLEFPSPKRVILKRGEPKVTAKTDPPFVVPTTSAKPTPVHLDSSRFDNLAVALYSLLDTLNDDEDQTKSRVSEHHKLSQERWPQTFDSSTTEAPSTSTVPAPSPSYETQYSPEVIEMQYDFAEYDIQFDPDSFDMQVSPELFETDPYLELIQMQPVPDPRLIPPHPFQPHMQSLEMQDSSDMQCSPQSYEMQYSPQTEMDQEPDRDPCELESMRMEVDTPSPQEHTSSSDL